MAWGKSIFTTSLLLLQSAMPWDCDRAPVTSWQRWRYGKDCTKKGKEVAKMEKVASGPSATLPLPYHKIEPRDLIKPVVLNGGAGNESTAIAVCFIGQFPRHGTMERRVDDVFGVTGSGVQYDAFVATSDQHTETEPDDKVNRQILCEMLKARGFRSCQAQLEP